MDRSDVCMKSMSDRVDIIDGALGVLHDRQILLHDRVDQIAATQDGLAKNIEKKMQDKLAEAQKAQRKQMDEYKKLLKEHTERAAAAATSAEASAAAVAQQARLPGSTTSATTATSQ